MFHNRGSIIAQYTCVTYIEYDLVRLWIPAGALPPDPRSLALRFVGFTHSACHYYSQLFSTTQIGLARTLLNRVISSILRSPLYCSNFPSHLIMFSLSLSLSTLFSQSVVCFIWWIHLILYIYSASTHKCSIYQPFIFVFLSITAYWSHFNVLSRSVQFFFS